MKHLNEQLMEEQKESQSKIEQLERELESVKLGSYKTWKWQEILQWILSVDAGFQEYEQDLRYSSTTQRFSGKPINNAYFNEEGDQVLKKFFQHFIYLHFLEQIELNEQL